jgi:hypothetical protein
LNGRKGKPGGKEMGEVKGRREAGRRNRAIKKKIVL